ncbi:fused MFS/spermidine synthase [Corallococcus exercitus]|uniref:Fused MFS/spermidine synthase n=1 Tax=Corallococcus exercitus TaxID=2316736 RepID=A0A7Y4JRC7_9BACT|nr:fused MFS/spermidine synthase [Corallococcus exercitus]NOK09769.1 fused MFS/spermidine synthase [Corallococcus exercitus]
MNTRVGRVAPLLFGSGLCALVYQTVWLREFRLIFGASTAASAAVLAIFMAGLGLGSALLGERADRQARPLAFYANLELLIAASAALSPFLVEAVRAIYIALGGTPVMGLGLGTVVRLVLSLLVLAVPTVLMGGTLPAAARAVLSDADPHRRDLALLYGINTLGAVTGAAASTFLLLEVLGNRSTLWVACLLNALVAITARSVSRSMESDAPAPAAEPAAPAAVAAAPVADGGALPPRGFVLVAAAIVGFAFLLMELVWYRMLGPILGGTTFTFGIILAMALLGIGLGGAAYTLFFRHRPATLQAFALTCAAEAVLMAVPFALGDWLAILAALLRPMGGLGLGGMALGWTFITSVVVLPAAFVSGVQFPLLIALIGRGRQDAGRQVGQMYAWNTGGSIVGSLAGGFGVIPLLSAPVTWQAVAGLLAALGLGAAVLSFQRERQRGALVAPVLATGLAVLLLTAQGPTAAWRHSGVGAGRSGLREPDRQQIDRFLSAARADVTWEHEGVESSVALAENSGLNFVVNGKVDGNALDDAATQIMSGLIGTMLHPAPRTSLVIGLGTGSTAGWMGQVRGMERVDVVEIEPAILEVARRCHAVNANVMDNPKVHTSIGDAREVLLTTPQRYDIIFSEPSNPYRAGISSLFTREFYQAAKQRLAEGGLFLQWLQAYEVDALTIQSAYATLSSEFASVETWNTLSGDLVLVASMQPLAHDLAKLRARIAEEPYRTALHAVWQTDELEGVLAHFVGNAGLARLAAERGATMINTDDLSSMEFAFARSVGRTTLFSTFDLRRVARRLKLDRLEFTNGAPDWNRVDELRLWLGPAVPGQIAEQGRPYEAFVNAVMAGQSARVLSLWQDLKRQPQGPQEEYSLAHAMVMTRHPAALAALRALRARRPADADMLEALLMASQGQDAQAAALLERAFTTLRQDPWAVMPLTEAALDTALRLGQRSPELARRLYAAVAQPFAASAATRKRKLIHARLAFAAGGMALCVEGLAPLEPHVPWDRSLLVARAACYAQRGDPRADAAQDDVERILAQSPAPFLGDVEAEEAPTHAPREQTPPQAEEAK